MKTIVHICAFAFLSFATVSCTKSDVIPASITSPGGGPAIYSKISKTIMQPVEMELGSASATIHEGETVTIFVPYSVANEEFTSAKLIMTDDATGLGIKTYDLIASTDESAEELTLPPNLHKKGEFFFVTFVADEAFAGKTVSMTSILEGQITNSTDVLNAAFTVIPQ